MSTLWDKILTLSPLALYKHDETSGTTMVDSSGNARNGTIDVGVVLNSTSILPNSTPGGSWLLNAVEGGSVAGASWMAPATAYTGIVFFKASSLVGGQMTAMARSDINASNSANSKAWAMVLTATGVVTGRVFNSLGSNVNLASAAGAVTTGNLVMLAISHDGTTAKIRKNGSTSIASAALAGAPVPFATNSQPLTFGKDASVGVTAFNGNIQGGAFFGSALSDANLDAIWAWAQSYFVDLGGTVPAITAAFTVETHPEVTLVGSIPAVTGAFSVGTPATEMTLAGAVPTITGAFSVDIESNDVTLAGTLPAVTGSFHTSGLSREVFVEADTPLVWLRLGDASGSVATDSSGNGNDGTVSGALGWGHDSLVPTNPANDAATFNGDVITVPITGGDEITVEGVIGELVGNAILAERSGFFQILAETNSGASKRIQVLNSRTNRSVLLNYDGTSGNTTAWAVVLTSTSTLLYVRQSTSLVPGDAILDTGTYLNVPPDVNTDLTIGGGTSGSPINAVLDEIAYYDEALTLEQVTRHANLGYVLEPAATLAGTIAAVTGAFVVTKTDTVTLAGTITRPTGAFSITVPNDIALDGTIAAVTGAFALDIRADVTLDGQIPAVTGTFLSEHGKVTLAGVQQNVQASFSLVREESIVLAGAIPAITGAFALVGNFEVILAGQIAVEGSFSIGFPPQTETGNRASGRVRDGIGVVFYEPPVVAPPEFSIASHFFVSVRAYASVAMDGVRPTFGAIAKSQAKRALDRVLVGGKDVTYFRGVATPAPSYGLVVPLLYGPATLDLPQVSATFEQPGAGDLSWCAKGKKVLVQRVDPDTLEVIATDYKGIVIAHNISGRHLQLQIGGEATGRAALIDKQPPLFFKRNDLGFWHWGGIADLGLPFEPRLGIDTGIRLRNAGGMDHLSYLQDLSAKGTRGNGAQLTIMPDAHEDGGAYRTVTKDVETIHATVYLDDDLSVPDLRDDLAEQPNRAYATGVTPEGMRVKFGAYPVLRDDTPPPYPMTDDSHFGVGTEDGDTDTGDGVSVMIWRLVKAGFLTLADKPGGFDNDVADAIRDLKEIYLSGTVFIDGDMTPQAWAALFDASATGYSLAGTQILPAAQRSKTRQWNRTANGSVISKNEDYDPTVIKVDTTIDAGVGATRRQIRGFAKGKLTPGSGANNTVVWVGTITLNSGAVIRGEHTPGDAITVDDVMDARALRPGMNLWAPLFAGGTLLHVAGIERRVDDSGQSTISLDIGVGDTMDIWERIRRNRESRRNLTRAWLNQHRSSALTKDSIVEFDEIGGVLDDRVDLAGGAWTVFPVVAGQEGFIRSLKFKATPATEYVCAVFGRQINAERLQELIGNPLTKGGRKRWADEDILAKLDEDYVKLYIAGEKREPLGYFPGLKHADPLEVDESDDDATDAPDAVLLTGRWEDDAGFSYHTFGSPVLWVAMWAAEATHLSPGRVMWPQLEAGS